MRRHELSDVDCGWIAPLLSGKGGDVGRTAAANWQFLNEVLWIIRNGAPWRDLPERYENWNSVFQQFRSWAKKRVWLNIFEAFEEPDLDWLLLDSTMVRAHQHAAGQKNDRLGCGFRQRSGKLFFQAVCCL